jgi:hypothetical protein
MTSSFSPNKGLEEPASGDYVNAWATPANANWTALDAALGGTTSISVTGVSAPTTTLTLTQYRPPNIEFSGTLGANLNYQIPTGVGGLWSINNATSGAFALAFSIAAGNSLTLGPGRILIISDGATVALATQGGQGGTYSPTFQSGSVQVAGPNGVPQGFGDFQWGFLLPNASGIPSSGVLIGGAGKSQVVHITDAQITGQKGITVIRSAGDADSTPGNPGLDAGGDLLDFAGASLNGLGGAYKAQGGTSVNSIAGDSTLQGGNATGINPNAQSGNAVVSSGVVGKKCGIGVILSANIPPGATGTSVIRHQFGTATGTILVVDEFFDGSKFLYNLSAFPSVSRGGFGAVGQVEISNGIGQPTFWGGLQQLAGLPTATVTPNGTVIPLWSGYSLQFGSCNPNGGTVHVTWPQPFATIAIPLAMSVAGGPVQTWLGTGTSSVLLGVDISNTGGTAFWAVIGK